MTTISVWEKFSGYLRNFINQKAANAADAEDILQEVFLKVHKNLHQLSKIEKLESWLFRITRNVIADFYKKRGKELKIRTLVPNEKAPTFSLEAIKDLDFLAANMESLLEKYNFKNGSTLKETTPEEALEFFKIVCPFLETISPKYAEAVFMVDYLGMSQKDLATHLDISISGAKSRVQRGRENLKQLFLQCCDFEFDARGRVINYQRKSTRCHNC